MVTVDGSVPPRGLASLRKLRSLYCLSSLWLFSAFPPPLRVSPETSGKSFIFSGRKWRKCRPSVPSFFFSAFFSALSPRLRVSASNGPAPAASLSGVSSPQEHRQQSIRVLRVEWAPPLACREFPRPQNIDITRCACSAARAKDAGLTGIPRRSDWLHPSSAQWRLLFRWTDRAGTPPRCRNPGSPQK